MQNAFHLKKSGMQIGAAIMTQPVVSDLSNTIHPPLRPAFRVRRGTRTAWVDMTRHVGSRASCYPPDFVSFRRRAGALFAGAPRRHRSLGRSPPPSLWGALFGNATKSGGCTDGNEISQLAQTRPDGKQRRRARPSSRPTPESDRSQWWVLTGRGPHQSGAEKSPDRRRSSAGWNRRFAKCWVFAIEHGHVRASPLVGGSRASALLSVVYGLLRKGLVSPVGTPARPRDFPEALPRALKGETAPAVDVGAVSQHSAEKARGRAGSTTRAT